LPSVQEDTPLLAAYMDVQAAYGCGRNDKETASLCVKGLRAETQIVAGQQAASTDMVANLHGGIVRRGAGITQVHRSHTAQLPCAGLRITAALPVFSECRTCCDCRAVVFRFFKVLRNGAAEARKRHHKCLESLTPMAKLTGNYAL
jgi:hypothetical protein